jgi:hypothetical protein
MEASKCCCRACPPAGLFRFSQLGRVTGEGAEQESRPYLYHYASTFSRSHELSLTIARKELDKGRVQISSAPAAWEQFAVNAGTLVFVTNLPLSASQTYVHVIATSNADASAAK